MIAQLQKTGWGVLHQLTLMVALLLFPVTMLTQKAGYPVGTSIQPVVKKVNTKYKHAADRQEA